MLYRLNARAKPDGKRSIGILRPNRIRSTWERQFKILMGQGETFELTKEDLDWLNADLQSPLKSKD